MARSRNAKRRYARRRNANRQGNAFAGIKTGISSLSRTMFAVFNPLPHVRAWWTNNPSITANDHVAIDPASNTGIQRTKTNASEGDTVPISSDQNNIVECRICLDDINEMRKKKSQIMSTVCGHVFCRCCIETSIKKFKCCPVCKKSLNKEQIHLLFI